MISARACRGWYLSDSALITAYIDKNMRRYRNIVCIHIYVSTNKFFYILLYFIIYLTMYVCMYVSMYVCMYVCMYVWVDALHIVYCVSGTVEKVASSCTSLCANTRARIMSLNRLRTKAAIVNI